MQAIYTTFTFLVVVFSIAMFLASCAFEPTDATYATMCAAQDKELDCNNLIPCEWKDDRCSERP